VAVWTAREAFAVIERAWDGGPALLGRGQFEHDNRIRLGLLRLADTRPRLLWAGYVDERDAAELRGKLAAKGALDDGHLDFMFATRWRVAWAIAPDRIAIYSRRGLRAVVTGTYVDRRRLAGTQRILRTEIADVQGEGGAFQARTRVCLRLASGRALTIVSAYDLLYWVDLDPSEIYESWPHRLAQEMKRRLGI
jgi:hypothetical protein